MASRKSTKAKSTGKEKPPKKNSEEFKILTGFESERSKIRFKQSIMSSSIPSMNTVLKNSGGISCLYELYQDNEIIKSDIDKRIASLTSTNYNIEASSAEAKQIIEENIQGCFYDLVNSIIWSVFHGYSVTELVWDEFLAKEQDKFVLKKVFSRQSHLFAPLFDLRSCIYLGNSTTNKEVAPFGKYLLTVCGGTPENPHGDALLARLYWLHIYRKKSFNFWIKTLEKFGYPLLYGKTIDSNKVEDLMNMLEEVREGSSIASDKDTEIEILQGQINADNFVKFEESARQRIHLTILGQNLTSEVQSGSLAAAKVHQDVSFEKTQSDIRLIEDSINYLIRIILVLNGMPDDDGCIIIEPKQGLERARAERDQILCNSGKIKLTEAYYQKHYDLDDEDFEVIDNPQIQAPVNFLKQEFERLELAERKLSPQNQELEDLTNFLANRADTVFNLDSLVAAIQASKNKKQLIENLSSLSGNPDISFEELLTQAYYFSMVKGAISGN